MTESGINQSITNDDWNVEKIEAHTTPHTTVVAAGGRRPGEPAALLVLLL